MREKLRLLLKRSPDPNEIQEEMQRDKGYGGRKRKVQNQSMEPDRTTADLFSSDLSSSSRCRGDSASRNVSDSLASHKCEFIADDNSKVCFLYIL